MAQKQLVCLYSIFFLLVSYATAPRNDSPYVTVWCGMKYNIMHTHREFTIFSSLFDELHVSQTSCKQAALNTESPALINDYLPISLKYNSRIRGISAGAHEATALCALYLCANLRQKYVPISPKSKASERYHWFSLYPLKNSAQQDYEALAKVNAELSGA